MRENIDTTASYGKFWLYPIGDSHIACDDTAYRLPKCLGDVLRNNYGCSVRVRQWGLSGDTTHVSSNGPGIRERSGRLLSPTVEKPTIVLLEGGVNNLTYGLTNADITTDFKSIIRAFRNGVYPCNSPSNKGIPTAVYQSGIVTSISALPSGMPKGRLMLVTADDASSNGVNKDSKGNTISTTPPTIQGIYTRKTLSSPAVDQIWVSVGNGQAGNKGWYRTYSEEDIAAGGYFTTPFVPYIRYFMIEGLHLYYGSEANGSPVPGNTAVRAAQQQVVTDLNALTNSPYVHGAGYDLLYLDTFTPMSTWVASATPASDPSVWSAAPGINDSHLGAEGNYCVASIIAEIMNSTLNADGNTWTSMLGGNS